jgi:hypothetical protein
MDTQGAHDGKSPPNHDLLWTTVHHARPRLPMRALVFDEGEYGALMEQRPIASAWKIHGN